MKCIICNKKPIEIKKRKTCYTCYQRYMNKKKQIISLEERLNEAQTIVEFINENTMTSREKLVQRLNEKYGKSFIEDIEKMREDGKVNAAEIGRKYGLSRERVRVLYKDLFNESVKENRKKNAEIGDDKKLSIPQE